MDQGLYILGGIAVLVVVVLAYLIYAIASYRAAVRKARDAAERDDQPDAEARYLAEDRGDLFAAAREGVAPARDPVVPSTSRSAVAIGTADVAAAPFHIPEVRRTESPRESPARPPLTERGDAEVSTEVEEPVARQAPSPEASARDMPDAAPPAPVADAAPAVLSPGAPLAEPVVAATMPGYSLGDELERLMHVAEEQQPLMPSGQQEPPVPAEPASDPEPTFEAPPLMPPLSIGKALSSPAPVAESEPTPALVPIAEPAPPSAAAPAPAASLAEPSPVEDSSVPEYALVAPVELHFTAGPGRVGVKPGTRSHAEFQRLAAILLGDLHATRDR